MGAATQFVSATEAVRATGLSKPTFRKYVQLGKIPSAEIDRETGKPLYNVEHVLAAMERHGIKARTRNKGAAEAIETEETPDVPQADDEVPPAEEPVEAVAAEAAAMIKRALRRAERAFKRSLLQSIDGNSLEPEHELMLLRLHARSDALFDTVAQELCS